MPDQDAALTSTWKCRWAPNDWPVLPTLPICCPRVTCWPAETKMAEECMYFVMRPLPWEMTIQLPALSLKPAMITVPDSAA